MIKFIFGMQMNIEVFYKLIQSFWVCVTRRSQSTQNKKFAYLQKRMADEVDFLPGDKHESFPQADSITLGVRSEACPKY